MSVFYTRFQPVGQCSHEFKDLMTLRGHEVQIGRHSSPHERTMHKTSDKFSDERQRTTNSGKRWGGAGGVGWGGVVCGGVARVQWRGVGWRWAGWGGAGGVARSGIARVGWRGER